MKKLLLLLFAALLLVSSCKKEDDPINNPTNAKKYKVTYSIACNDCQVIYYKDSLGTQQTENHRNSSWSYTFYGKKNQSALLFAYNTDSVPRGVTATISVNDSVLTTQTRYCAVSGYAFVEDTIR